jgi:hypothetical protein
VTSLVLSSRKRAVGGLGMKQPVVRTIRVRAPPTSIIQGRLAISIVIDEETLWLREKKVVQLVVGSELYNMLSLKQRPSLRLDLRNIM